MRREMIGVALALLSLASAAPAQDQPIRLKGGHVLGESAEQFFGEGYEKAAFSACQAGDFKSLNLPSKRKLKDYCMGLVDARQQATSGKRSEYKGSGDVSELRDDTFTFDDGRLVKAELRFSAPSAEFSYRGQSLRETLRGNETILRTPDERDDRTDTGHLWRAVHRTS